MYMKRCPRCKQNKNSNEFGKNRAKKDGLQGICKLCKRLRDKRHYDENKSWYNQRNEKAHIELLRWYREAKLSPCADCKQSYHFTAMEWDHLPEFEKVESISLMVRRGCSKSKILNEIAKCELVCANCHRVRTWNRCGLGELVNPPDSESGDFLGSNPRAAVI